MYAHESQQKQYTVKKSNIPHVNGFKTSEIVKYETNLTFLKCDCNKSRTCNKSFSQQKSNRYVDLHCKCKHTSYCKQTVLLIYEDTCY